MGDEGRDVDTDSTFAPPSTEEQELIRVLRCTETAAIKAVKKGGHLDLIEIERNIDIHDEKNLSRLLRQHPFQDLIVKCEDGRTTFIKQTIKIKPK